MNRRAMWVVLLTACGGGRQSAPPPPTGNQAGTGSGVAQAAGDSCERVLARVRPVVEKMMGRPLTTDEYEQALKDCHAEAADHKRRFAEVVACVDAAMNDEAIADCLMKETKSEVPRRRYSEAEINLNKIAKNAKTNYMATGAYPKGRAPVLPNARCCAQPAGKCALAVDAWTKDPVWYEIEFVPDAETMFQYSYESLDGQSFVATAIGDLDCDGTPGVWTMTGTATNGNNPSATLKPPPNGVY